MKNQATFLRRLLAFIVDENRKRLTFMQHIYKYVGIGYIDLSFKWLKNKALVDTLSRSYVIQVKCH